LDKDYFPFESYIFSTYIKEYNKDVRRRNYIVKYINLLCIDNQDSVSLNKLIQNLIFFRNVFAKEAFLIFFNENFKMDEKKVLGVIVFDMFVKSDIGEVGEQKVFFNEAVKLYEFVDHTHIINKNWEVLKSNQEIRI
jgi:hypothetical protein